MFKASETQVFPRMPLALRRLLRTQSNFALPANPKTNCPSPNLIAHISPSGIVFQRRSRHSFVSHPAGFPGQLRLTPSRLPGHSSSRNKQNRITFSPSRIKTREVRTLADITPLKLPESPIKPQLTQISPKAKTPKSLLGYALRAFSCMKL